jgi:uroporphyrinogen decarboxylase
VELYRKLIDEGVEIVLLGDDYAGKTGPFMSPAHFERFILPGLKTVVQEVKRKGAYCIKHTDGNIWKIVDMIISTGIDMLGPLESAYMALDEVRSHAHGLVGVMGNIDVDLLSRGTVEDVVHTTKELIRNVSPPGGHILSSGNSISSSVTGENFMAMIDTVKQHGSYPISI